jgi:hypothetical protein
MRNLQCDAEFEYQISTCPRAEENLGETWLHCSVVDRSGCILTSSMQSSIQVDESQRQPLCMKLRYLKKYPDVFCTDLFNVCSFGTNSSSDMSRK